MALVTKNSVFYHIGKTGGHSVRHILWSANLIRNQIQPIHIRPTEFRAFYPQYNYLYSFCFVRHPLEWLSSIWIHNMSYGSTDPTMPDEKTFANFLEVLSEQHPTGTVAERLGEYVDACRFVGRLESLHADLLYALREAGEAVDLTKIVPVRMNEGAVQALKNGARAPRSLLIRMLERDRAFAQRFGYDGVPEFMVSDAPRLSLPSLVVDRNEQQGRLEGRHEDAVLEHPVWLSSGPEMSARTNYRRYGWQVWIALTSVEERGLKSCAAFLDEDGSYGHLAAALGFADVTSIAVERRRSAEILDEMLETKVRRQPFDALPTLRGQFDVVLHSSFSEARSPTVTLSMLASLLRPRGRVLLRVELLQGIDKPLNVLVTPMQSPIGPLATILMSRSAIEALLTGAGFVEVRFIDSFMCKPSPEQRANAARIAQQFDLDPENLTVTTIISARYEPTGQPTGPTAAALEDAWMHARSLWVSDPANIAVDAPLRRLVEHQQASLTTIEAERAVIRGALADRETDLASARQQFHATLIELEKVCLERDILRGALADREADLARERVELVRLRAEYVQLTKQ